MDKETFTSHLEGQINLTRIIEIKPYSSLLVVCVVSDMDTLAPEAIESISTRVGAAIAKLLDGQRVEVIVSDADFDIDFYRFDPNG